MLKSIQLKFLKIKYSGDSIGRDIRVEIEVLGKFLRVDKRIQAGETQKIDQEIGRVETSEKSIQSNVSITITEKDLLFSDTGSIKSEIQIDANSTEPQLFTFEIEVKESRSIFSWLFWGKRKAVFEVVLGADITESEQRGSIEDKVGKIALYSDIDPEINTANLRERPDDKSNVLEKIPNQARIIIVRKAVNGVVPEGYLSDLWHEIFYQGTQGFVHSALVEIRGQEREKIIEAIQTKAKELGIDEKLALNLAYCESKWLPFAHSKTDNKGIYQLGDSTIRFINENLGGNVVDAWEPFQNIDGGLRYLVYLFKRYVNSPDSLIRTVAAFNAGPNAVPGSGQFNLKNYVAEVSEIVDCALKERRGEKALQYLKMFVFVLLVGAGILSLIPADIIEDDGREAKVLMSAARSEISYLQDGENIADISPDAARVTEMRLGDLQTDLDGDKKLERISFYFLSPEPFFYLTHLYAPDGEKVTVNGSLWRAFADDLTGDGVKELVVKTITGQMSATNIFSYKKGSIEKIPVLDDGRKMTEEIGLLTSLEIRFEDLDNNGSKEIILPIRNYGDEFIEPTYYYRWTGKEFALYHQENIDRRKNRTLP